MRKTINWCQQWHESDDGISDKDVETVVIKISQQSIMNSVERNEKIENTKKQKL